MAQPDKEWQKRLHFGTFCRNHYKSWSLILDSSDQSFYLDRLEQNSHHRLNWIIRSFQEEHKNLAKRGKCELNSEQVTELSKRQNEMWDEVKAKMMIYGECV
jgi:hypothetical protein